MPNELTRVHPSMMKDAFFFNTFLIGSIIPITASATYTPYGCLQCDAADYTRDLFTGFYDNYLITGKLLTCTYAEYSAQVALTGNCMKFAVDDTAKTFKVPLIKDGDSITQAASITELGKSYKAGLPDAQATLPWWTGNVGGETLVTDGMAYTPNVAVSPLRNIPGEGSTTSGTATKIALSHGNAIYGNSTTVTDEQVRLRHFVVVANAQNNKSVFDWSNYMAALAGKANNDLSNLTQVGTTAIAHNAMPSTRMINVSGSVWLLAHADGWAFADSGTTISSVTAVYVSANASGDPVIYCSGGRYDFPVVTLPVKKGMYYKISAISAAKFIYAEGVY